MNIGEVPAGTPLHENPSVCQPGCRVRDDPWERTMSEDSRYGTQQQKGEAGEGIPTLGRKVAGIDIGSKPHWVCAPAREGSGREVEVFGATTPALHRMAAWLLERNVESRWHWRARGCTGFQFMRFWKSMDSRCGWSIRESWSPSILIFWPPLPATQLKVTYFDCESACESSADRQFSNRPAKDICRVFHSF